MTDTERKQLKALTHELRTWMIAHKERMEQHHRYALKALDRVETADTLEEAEKILIEFRRVTVVFRDGGDNATMH